MASIKMSQIQTLEEFLEEDLLSLIKPDYENTIVHLERRLVDFDLSIEEVIEYYPNFLERVRFHLVFFLANQLNDSQDSTSSSFPERYQAVSLIYQDHYVRSFIEKQVQDILQRQAYS